MQKVNVGVDLKRLDWTKRSLKDVNEVVKKKCARIKGQHGEKNRELKIALKAIDDEKNNAPLNKRKRRHGKDHSLTFTSCLLIFILCVFLCVYWFTGFVI